MNSASIIASLIIVAGGLFGNYLRFNVVMPDEPVKFERIPFESPGYSGVEHRFDETAYQVLQADTSTLRSYRTSSGKDIWLFLSYFASQEYGSQIHSPKHCLPGGGWQIQDLHPFEISLPGNITRHVNRLVITQKKQRQMMLYWFETRGGLVRGEYALKWDLMKNSMLFRPTDAAFVRLTISLQEGETIESATAMALDYIDSFYPAIVKALPFSRSDGG